MESADVIFLKNDLKDVVRLLKITRSAYRKIVENLAWTIVKLSDGSLSSRDLGPSDDKSSCRNRYNEFERSLRNA